MDSSDSRASRSQLEGLLDAGRRPPIKSVPDERYPFLNGDHFAFLQGLPGFICKRHARKQRQGLRPIWRVQMHARLDEGVAIDSAASV